jgi:hypothetical protein
MRCSQELARSFRIAASIRLIWLSFFLPCFSAAQELEPRRWTHLPVGANFAGVGYAYTDGNIFLDPAVLIEGAKANVNSSAFAYIRSLDILGKTGRVELMAPYSVGRWEGVVNGEFASVRRNGFGDPRVRLAVNLSGSPAQSVSEFSPSGDGTIFGAALDISAPWGEYRSDRLANLGSNRWVLTPQLGVVHTRGQWAFEVTGSVFLYGDNDEYFGEVLLEQDPLFALQSHAIYTFRPGLWASLSVGIGERARSTVDGVEQNNRQSNVLWAASVGIPIDRRQGVKIAFMKGTTSRAFGVDYDRLILAYSFMWGDGL